MSSKPSAVEVRRQFIDFFSKREHRELPSGPVFPQDDPTLLFTNAGMNQFKDVFLGTGTRDYTRAVDTQKCIRVSGKHNDLEEVGVDTYHHTFFEMLGNWSFGDYFKRDAIIWAWELLTEVWKLPKERLWVTVFSGDKTDGLPADEEAEAIWLKETNIDPSHVLRFDRRDNFWEMGETGPCGPCSEIHIDRGDADSEPLLGANPELGVNAGNERFIELWNLVFMQYNRLGDGSLKELPANHVDTGMGFERVLSVLQGVHSNYDTDLFAPIFARIGELSGQSYGDDETRDIAFRVIADHMRAISSALADGALPSNTGRGYVLRRLLRRAARYGRQALGMEEPFLFEVIPAVAAVLGQAFPEISGRIEHLQLIVRKEEESFGRTLGRGIIQFDRLADSVAKAEGDTLKGEDAFELYATYGFPRDLVELMARERNLKLDASGWERAETEHRNASRSEGAFKQLLTAEDLEGLSPTVSTYHPNLDSASAGDFEASLAGRSEVVRVIGEDPALLILSSSPFYAESGGQIGDRGVIADPEGRWSFRVDDTKKMGAVIVHLGELSGSEPSAGDTAECKVDRAHRQPTQRNHTATHLLHAALREVLGEHVAQQGSYVGPDRLRFDFSNPRGMEPDEIDRVEQLVNAEIFRNQPVQTTVEDLEAAKERGVTALFGEKYDEQVRVVAVGDWSTELCGGTHVHAAGDIGPFAIVSEAAIQAGVRRIEAITGAAAVEWMQTQRKLLQSSARALKAGAEELPERIAQLQKQLKEARKKEAASALADVGSVLEKVRAQLQPMGGIPCAVLDLPDMGQAALRELGTRVKSLGSDLALCLFGRDGGRVPFLIACQGAALEKKLSAGALAKVVGGVLGGGGGGRPEMAQGQGQDPKQVGAAIEVVKTQLQASLGA